MPGLLEAWQRATPILGTPQAVPDALAIVAALAWLALRRPAGADGYAVAVLTLISALSR